MNVKYYSMKEVCSMTGLSYETLKLYCKEGLIPDVKRDKNNYRIFDDNNIGWIKNLLCLKKCGMSFSEIKTYMQLCKEGKETIPARKKLLLKKLRDLHDEEKKLKDNINYINMKMKFYDDVIKNKVEYFSYLNNDN